LPKIFAYQPFHSGSLCPDSLAHFSPELVAHFTPDYSIVFPDPTDGDMQNIPDTKKPELLSPGLPFPKKIKPNV
jgi:hypothetical protein